MYFILLTIILVVVQNLVTKKNIPPGQRMVMVISNVKFRASQLVWPS